MSVEQNKAIVRRYFEEVHNRGNLDVIDEIFAPSYVYHGHDLYGPQGKREQQGWLLANWADIRSDIQMVIGEGDLVAIRYLYSFTHSSPIAGVSATGRRVSATSIDIFRVVDDKVVEQWSNEDWYGVLKQIGAAPSESPGG